MTFIVIGTLAFQGTRIQDVVVHNGEIDFKDV
jgi:hypothetical protein